MDQRTLAAFFATALSGRGRHAKSLSFAAHAPQCHGGGVLPILGSDKELERTTTHYRKLGRRNYGFALLLAVSALIASAAIAIGGILFDASGKVLGVIALVPAIATLISTVLQPQGRSSWHYKKKDKLNALRRRLLYQLPESPSTDNAAAIAKEWDGIDDEMNEAWEKNLSIDLSPITRIPKFAGKEGEGT